MAVVQNTLIGRARGRVGNAVFRTHKGQNIVSQKAEVVANPRTALQQSNRARFTALLAIGRLLRPLIVIGFKEYSGSMSWLNKFMSTNTQSDLLIWDAGATEWIPNNQNLVIAEGSLQQNPFNIAAITNAGFSIEWDATPVANQSVDDKLSFLVSKPNAEPLFFRFNGGAPVDRDTGTASVLYDLVDGDVLTVVAFFVRNDGSIVSNSYAIVQEVNLP